MRIRAGFAWAIGALLVVVGNGLRPVVADPPQAGPTPAERAEQVLKALPAPSASEPWTFEADVLINGQTMGSARFTLTPVKEGEADLWKASDGVRFGPAEAPATTVAMEALFDAQLTTLSGKTVSTSPGQPDVTFRWKRTPLGYGLERQEGEKEPERLMVRDAAYLKTSVGGLVRFLRAVPAEPATYAVQLLNQDANVGMTPETRVHDVTIEVLGVKPFTIGGGEREAWVVRVVKPDDERFLAFEPKDRRLLTLTKPASRLELRRKGLEVAAKPVEKTPLDWQGPAKTAELAALQSARAFATSDLKAIERLMWWPGVLEQVKDKPEFAGLDDAARKAKVLEGIRTKLQAFPAAMIEPLLEGMRDQIVATDAPNGRRRFVFPESFRGLVVIVLESEGVWYLESSGTPKPPEKEKPPAPPPPPPADAGAPK